MWLSHWSQNGQVPVDILLKVSQVEEEVVLPVFLVELSHGAGRGHHDLVLDVQEQWGFLRPLHFVVDELDQVSN